jgi:putative peptide zinc metalloprotease protein
VVAASTEHYLNAEMPGELTALNAVPGDSVDDARAVLTLSNPDVEAEYRVSKAQLQEAVLARDILFERDRIQAARMAPRVQQLKRELLEAQRRFSTLRITSPGTGLLARILPESQRGRFIQSGETVGIVVDGQPVIRTWLTEDQLGGIASEPGQVVEYRLAGRSETTYTARLLNIEPAAEIGRLNQSLTFVAGGEILLDPQTGRPVQPLFQVDFEPLEQQTLRLADHGIRLSLQLPRNGQTIAEWVTHRLTRFVQKTLMAI